MVNRSCSKDTSVSLVLLETGQGGRGAPDDSIPMSQLGFSPATSSRHVGRGDRNLCRRARSLGQTQQEPCSSFRPSGNKAPTFHLVTSCVGFSLLLTLCRSQNGCVTRHVTPPSRGERTDKAGSTFMKKAKAFQKNLRRLLLGFLIVCTVPQG